MGICPELHSQYETGFIFSVVSKRGSGVGDAGPQLILLPQQTWKKKEQASKCMLSLAVLFIFRSSLPSDEPGSRHAAGLSLPLRTVPTVVGFRFSDSDIPKERWAVSAVPTATFSLQSTRTDCPSSPSPDALEERQPVLSPNRLRFPGC